MASYFQSAAFPVVICLGSVHVAFGSKGLGSCRMTAHSTLLMLPVAATQRSSHLREARCHTPERSTTVLHVIRTQPICKWCAVQWLNGVGADTWLLAQLGDTSIMCEDRQYLPTSPCTSTACQSLPAWAVARVA
jgi:hypothetical protein